MASPSCHSNGEEAEMQEFSDQVNQRFSEQVSCSSIVGKVDISMLIS